MLAWERKRRGITRQRWGSGEGWLLGGLILFGKEKEATEQKVENAGKMG